MHYFDVSSELKTMFCTMIENIDKDSILKGLKDLEMIEDAVRLIYFALSSSKDLFQWFLCV